MKYIVDQTGFANFFSYRSALKDFLQRPSASADFAQNPAMQRSLLEAFLIHYHPDPSTGRPLLQREDITAMAVTAHPNWKTPCFGVVLAEDGRCESFAISKKRFRLEPRPETPSTTGPTPGQRTLNAYEALRYAVEPAVEQWGRENPLPSHCSITGHPMGPLSDRSDPLRRALSTSPTIDHYEPTFRELVQGFLQAESLPQDDLPLGYKPLLKLWELADDGLRHRWIEHHATGKLRWVSQEGQRQLNRRAQVDVD
jgi:hypothetical protein